jgi:hypothetical protein
MTIFTQAPLLTGTIAGALVGITAVIFATMGLFWDREPPSSAMQPSPSSGLLTQEIAAEAWDQQYLPVAVTDILDAIPVHAATKINIEFLSETGYYNEKEQYVIDLLELDYAYLSVQLLTPDKHPVEGAVPVFSIEGSSRLLQPDEVSSMPNTDDMGRTDFAVLGGQMGVDRVTVTVGDAQAEILINVISLRAAGFPQLADIEGGIPWKELTAARIRFDEFALEAEFPVSVSSQNGETVKLTGYIMPLEAELLQRRFLLTSNPPSCFFHVPGGPAGAVEILADPGIEVSWDPVVLEGRFETLRRSDVGVIYRLHNARLLSP